MLIPDTYPSGVLSAAWLSWHVDRAFHQSSETHLGINGVLPSYYDMVRSESSIMEYTCSTSYRTVLDQYSLQYDAALQSVAFRPFLFPLDFLNWGLFIGYLLASREQWTIVERARYVVFFLIVALSAQTVIHSRTLGLDYGVGVGLSSAWCILCSATLIVFHNPHRDFQRIVRRRGENTHPLNPDPPRQERPNVSESSELLDPSQIKPSSSAGPAAVASEDTTTREASKTVNKDYDLVWQSMPYPFIDRLDWVLDLITSLRGLHWSWRYSGKTPPPCDLVALSRPGSCNSLAIRLSRLLVVYLFLDALKVVMMEDPYFLGLVDCPPPAYLSFLDKLPISVGVYRRLLSFAGLHASMILNFGVGPLLFVDLLGPDLIGVRGERWMYPSGYGDFSAVLDRGLQGWWGEWWHQLFRFTISSAGQWLTRQLRLGQKDHSRFFRLFVAFSLSGALHASVSYGQWPATWPLGPLFFFMLQAIGIMLQISTVKILRKVLDGVPRSLRRTGNLAFVLIWLWWTFPLLADDFARGGLWLLEPLPISPLQGLWFSPGEWWRWHGTWIRWHIGHEWWQSGLAL